MACILTHSRPAEESSRSSRSAQKPHARMSCLSAQSCLTAHANMCTLTPFNRLFSVWCDCRDPRYVPEGAHHRQRGLTPRPPLSFHPHSSQILGNTQRTGVFSPSKCVRLNAALKTWHHHSPFTGTNLFICGASASSAQIAESF